MNKLLQKIIDWAYFKYRIELPRLDVLLFLIIVVGIIVLVFSIIVNRNVNRKPASPIPSGTNPAIVNPDVRTTNVLPNNFK